MKRVVFAGVFAIGLAANALAADTQYTLHVDGMTCPLCAIKVSWALRAIDGFTAVKAEIDRGLVKACVKEGVTLNEKQLRDVLLAKGYTYRGMEKQGHCSL